ncbi:MAG: hypothetical protein JWO10_370, partial [Microbacteriaceae bacterium]|nr:hypothetical protein [Microbacteriaceae bacterium]
AVGIVVRDDSALNEMLAANPATHIAWLADTATLLSGAVQALEDALSRFEADLAYGDATVAGAPLARPVFSPVRLRSQDYLGGIRVFGVDLLRALGGFREAAAGAHAYDASLRLAVAGAVALHVPARLVDEVAALPARSETELSVVRHHLDSLAVDAVVTAGRIRYPLPDAPLVSIVIPTRGSRATVHGADSVLVLDAVRGILERSTYRNVEFVIVADDPTPQAVIDELGDLLGDQLRLVRWEQQFNFSAKMNRGAVQARGEYIVLLNDDVELITPDWLEVLLGLVRQPGVGMVGTMLFFEDDTVQHAGHLYRDQWAGHIGLGWARGRDDQLASLSVDREVSGVTAACAMLPAGLFWQVGGLSHVFAGNYNDVDLCLKVRATGNSILWTPHAALYHFESKTRDATVAPHEIGALRQRWASHLLVDPYWP